MRQRAWYAAPRTARAAGKGAAPASLPSRGESLRKEGRPVRYPPLSHGAYLIQWLFEIGPAEQGFNGQKVLTHAEIHAWQRLTGTPLRPWEVRLLRRLSSEWVAEIDRASDPGAPPPDGRQPAEDPERLAKRLARTLESHAMRVERADGTVVHLRRGGKRVRA